MKATIPVVVVCSQLFIMRTVAVHPTQAAPSVVTATVDWATETVVTHTAATVEVDVMPFLGRADWGGPFNAYYEALANLGSEYGTWLVSIG